MDKPASNEYGWFCKYAPAIANLPPTISKEDVLRSPLRIEGLERLQIYYAPFDYVNEEAAIAIVGLTPGWTQAQIAYNVARTGLQRGLSAVEIGKAVKQQAAFAGETRTRLVRWLDGIGLATRLGIATTRSLFGHHAHLLHATSAIRYPVFVDGENYGGHAKPKFEGPIGRGDRASNERTLLYLFPHMLLANELRRASTAFVVPCGSPAQFAVETLLPEGVIGRERCLRGFPHPSPSFAQGNAVYNERQFDLRRQVDEWFDRVE